METGSNAFLKLKTILCSRHLITELMLTTLVSTLANCSHLKCGVAEGCLETNMTFFEEMGKNYDLTYIIKSRNLIIPRTYNERTAVSAV